jgi:hypothetical protein
MTHNEYCARNSVDTIVVSTDDVHKGVNEIFANKETYVQLQKNGFLHYLKEHSASAVGDKLMGVLESVTA